ncbi:hypothetical protein NC651_014441 [Populus alba x Populus x berolinensis]|nr:hypothetical protein NC651_014441 [Populus alba x Populus x berolinensis]
MVWTKNPNIENIANLPFLSSFTFNSANASGSSAKPSGSKLPPGPDGQDALCVDQARVAQVVKSTLAEDLGSSLEPNSLTELDTVAGQELGEDASQSSKHGPPGMDDFKLTVLGKGLWVSREASSVPAVVTRELTGQVGWGLTREWAQVFNTVWSVPWASGGNRLGGFPHGDTAVAHDLGGGGVELHRLAG